MTNYNNHEKDWQYIITNSPPSTGTLSVSFKVRTVFAVNNYTLSAYKSPKKTNKHDTLCKIRLKIKYLEVTNASNGWYLNSFVGKRSVIYICNDQFGIILKIFQRPFNQVSSEINERGAKGFLLVKCRGFETFLSEL